MKCEDCDRRDKCKEVCAPMEKFLRKQGIFSADYIRKARETPFSDIGEDTDFGKNVTWEDTSFYR